MNQGRYEAVHHNGHISTSMMTGMFNGRTSIAIPAMAVLYSIVFLATLNEKQIRT